MAQDPCECLLRLHPCSSNLRGTRWILYRLQSNCLGTVAPAVGTTNTVRPGLVLQVTVVRLGCISLGSTNESYPLQLPSITSGCIEFQILWAACQWVESCAFAVDAGERHESQTPASTLQDHGWWSSLETSKFLLFFFKIISPGKF